MSIISIIGFFAADHTTRFTGGYRISYKIPELKLWAGDLITPGLQ